MSTELTLARVFGCDAPVADVIFVHGLTGDPHRTWTASDNADFWPKWLEQDFPHISVYTLGYPASVFAKWARAEMDLFELARNVLERFAGIGIGQRPIIFVAHSLGGILVKIILRKSCEATDEDCLSVSDATKLVVFISTPHTGSAVANVLQSFPVSSHHVHLLANTTGFLDDLKEHYRTLTNTRPDLATVAYYEKHLTNGVLVVSRSSADPGITNAELVPLDKNHKNICSPRDLDDILYLGIKRRIQKAVTSTEESASASDQSTWTDDYYEKSTEDRRDLLQKLIDAGREHEYSYANNAQNRFARRYASTGLLKAAREDHENLLSEIETRFVTHVYHPLICQSAPDSDVRAALQEKVLDPLSRRPIGATRFSATSVMNGLYFLAEQCYIRWDTPK